MSAEEIKAAALAGDVERCRVLLDGPKSTTFPFGTAVFQRLCEEGEAAACRVMVEAGIDVNSRSFDRTPLMIAAGAGHLGVCEVLIDAGADTNWTNDLRDTALHCACSERRVDVVRLLLRSGARADAVDYVGQTPLMNAASCGNAAMCEALISGGASVDLAQAEGKGGMTPIALAIFYNKLGAFKVLSNARADSTINSSVGKGLTAFQFAVKSGALEIAEHLMADCGEDPAQCTSADRTMMQLAGTNRAMKDLLHSAVTGRLVTGALDAAPGTAVGVQAAPARGKGEAISESDAVRAARPNRAASVGPL